MRRATIWEAGAHDNESGSVNFWATTRKEAIAAARAYVAEDVENRNLYESVTKHRIELSSSGFAAWLNCHYVLDNG